MNEEMKKMILAEAKIFAAQQDNIKNFTSRYNERDDRLHIFFITNGDVFDWDLSDECANFDLMIYRKFPGTSTHSIPLSQTNIEGEGSIDQIVYDD